MSRVRYDVCIRGVHVHVHVHALLWTGKGGRGDGCCRPDHRELGSGREGVSHARRVGASRQSERRQHSGGDGERAGHEGGGGMS